jgi:hypothetical protein
MGDKRQIPDGPPIPMDKFTLGPRHDLSDELVGVEINGVLYTDRMGPGHADAIKRMAARLAEMNQVVAKLIHGVDPQ